MGVIRGATYGFAPDDIKYFVESHGAHRNSDLRTLKKIQQATGVSVGYILAPGRCANILSATLNARAKGVSR